MQALPPGFLRTLPPQLMSLQLKGCSLVVSDLLSVLPVMVCLRALDLGGVYPLDLNPHTGELLWVRPGASVVVATVGKS